MTALVTNQYTDGETNKERTINIQDIVCVTKVDQKMVFVLEDGTSIAYSHVVGFTIIG